MALSTTSGYSESTTPAIEEVDSYRFLTLNLSCRQQTTPMFRRVRDGDATETMGSQSTVMTMTSMVDDANESQGRLAIHTVVDDHNQPQGGGKSSLLRVTTAAGEMDN